MPDQTAEERIAELEQKVEDLAGFVGRLTRGMFGDDFDKYDCREEPLLVWEQFAPLPEDDDDDEPVGWWTYQAPKVMSVDA